MANKIPQISGTELGRVLVRMGFRMVGQKGSHMKFVRTTSFGREIVIVPNHRVIRKGTLSAILKQLRLNPKDLK
jgi:predicted RNA binding protein YcfA (HicA-like mRNA interferase family)